MRVLAYFSFTTLLLVQLGLCDIRLPGQNVDKDTLTSLGIKTLGWQGEEDASSSQIHVHHNYSKVSIQNQGVSQSQSFSGQKSVDEDEYFDSTGQTQTHSFGGQEKLDQDLEEFSQFSENDGQLLLGSNLQHKNSQTSQETFQGQQQDPNSFSQTQTHSFGGQRDIDADLESSEFSNNHGQLVLQGSNAQHKNSYTSQEKFQGQEQDLNSFSQTQTNFNQNQQLSSFGGQEVDDYDLSTISSHDNNKIYNAHGYGNRLELDQVMEAENLQNQQQFEDFPDYDIGQLQLVDQTGEASNVEAEERQAKHFYPVDKPIYIHGFKYPPEENVYPTNTPPEPHTECPKMATGQFVHPASCNQFLNCWKGRGFVQNCAPGTLFNPKTLECDFASKVQCLTGPRKPEQNQFVTGQKLEISCPAEYSGVVPHHTDCSKFINCANGVENIMDCPPGTLFSVKINNCDFPYKTECASWSVQFGNYSGGYYHGQAGQNGGNNKYGSSSNDFHVSGNQGSSITTHGYHQTQNYGQNQGGLGSQGHYVHGSQTLQGQSNYQHNQNLHNQGSSSGNKNIYVSGGESGYGGSQQSNHEVHGSSGNNNQQQLAGTITHLVSNTGPKQDIFSQYYAQNPNQKLSENQNYNQNQHKYSQGTNQHNYGTSYVNTHQQTQNYGQYQGGLDSQVHYVHGGQILQGQSTYQQNQNLVGNQGQYHHGQGQSQHFYQQGINTNQNQNVNPLSLNLKAECPDGATGLFPHPSDCAKFLNCANGQTFVQDCGPGTVFNPDSKVCDFPYKVKCQKSEDYHHLIDVRTQPKPQASNTHGLYTSQGNSGQIVDGANSKTQGSGSSSKGQAYNSGGLQKSSGEAAKCPEHASGLYPHPTICSKFLNCANGQTFIQDCGPGTVFNPISKVCDFPYNVECGSDYGEGLIDIKKLPTGDNTQDSHGWYDQNQKTNLNSNKNQQQGFSGQNQLGEGESSGKSEQQYHGQGQNTNWNSNWQQGQNPGTGQSSSSAGQDFYVENTGGNSQQQGSYGQNSNAQGSYGQGHVGSSSSHQGSYGAAGQQGSYGQNSNVQGSYGQGQVGSSSSHQGSYGTAGQQGSYGQNSNAQGSYGQSHSGSSSAQQGSYGAAGQQGSYGQNSNAHGSYGQGQVGSSSSQQGSYGQNQVGGSGYVQQGSYGSSTGQQGFHGHNKITGDDQEIQESKYYNQKFGSNQGQNIHTQQSGTRLKPHHSPPPFPSTDLNADYEFGNEDTTLEVGAIKPKPSNSAFPKRKAFCEPLDFHCSVDDCIPKSMICDGVKDCPNGADEQNCEKYLQEFKTTPNTILAVREKERFFNISLIYCAKSCLESKGFQCKSFSYRKEDGACFLSDTNVGNSGALIISHPYSYYEVKTFTTNCTNLYKCPNQKCINFKQVCDGINDCVDRSDEKGCSAEAFGYQIQLRGTDKKHEGRIEVKAFGKWGYICDDKFGLRDADVVCRELGFPLGSLEVKANSYYAQDIKVEDVFYMMDDVTCLGNETTVRDCDFNGWGVNNCETQEVVGVVCKTPLENCPKDYWKCDSQECIPINFVCDGVFDCTDQSDERDQYCEAPIELRLANGNTKFEGRVEIRYHGIWGTVCDDDFNDDSAKVVCKRLGFPGQSIAKKDGFFGAGSGPIWLDQVFCQGNESSLEHCVHWNWGEHNCEHVEDIGVSCSTTYDSNIEGIERRVKLDEPQLNEVLPEYLFPDRCGLRKDDQFLEDDAVHFRVVKGSVAEKGHYPWQASLRIKNKLKPTHWCGAIVISQKFILTAAHCLAGFAKGAYFIVAGDYNTDELEGTEQEAFIDEFYIHEKFRFGHKMNNDVAIIKLKGKGLVFTKDVQPICLPEADLEYQTGLNCTISGFGSIESGKSGYSHQLRAGWIPLQSREVCKMPHVYGSTLTEGMICAGSLDEGIDACDGDSGGPLACLHDGLFTLYGITSWGHHCGYANKPGVYVKVSQYRAWIDETIRKHS